MSLSLHTIVVGTVILLPTSPRRERQTAVPAEPAAECAVVDDVGAVRLDHLAGHPRLAQCLGAAADFCSGPAREGRAAGTAPCSTTSAAWLLVTIDRMNAPGAAPRPPSGSRRGRVDRQRQTRRRPEPQSWPTRCTGPPISSISATMSACELRGGSPSAYAGAHRGSSRAGRARTYAGRARAGAPRRRSTQDARWGNPCSRTTGVPSSGPLSITSNV